MNDTDKILKQVSGVIGDLLIDEMIRLSNTPVLLKEFVFGKYKGRTFEDVLALDRGYLEWLYGSESQKPEASQNEDLLHTLKCHLNNLL